VLFRSGLVVTAVIALNGRSDKTTGPPVTPPATELAFEIHCQRKDQSGSYLPLTADILPLYSGDRVQIHAKLPHAMYAVVVAITTAGEVVVLYPNEGDAAAKPVMKIDIPTGSNQWLPLEPPGGTETLVLLASEKPFGDMKQLRQDLAALGVTTQLDETSLLVGNDHGARLLMPGGTARDLGKRAVQSDKGFVDRLIDHARSHMQTIRVLAFPHREPTNKVTP